MQEARKEVELVVVVVHGRVSSFYRFEHTIIVIMMLKLTNIWLCFQVDRRPVVAEVVYKFVCNPRQIAYQTLRITHISLLKYTHRINFFYS